MAVEKSKKTILVIEDDETIRLMIDELLVIDGYKVISAADGMVGLKLLESESYDLVITDIVTPFVSGVGVITVLKEKFPLIPVIAITGYGEEPMEAAIEKNADIVLGKPLKMAVLKGHVERLLTR